MTKILRVCAYLDIVRAYNVSGSISVLGIVLKKKFFLFNPRYIFLPHWPFPVVKSFPEFENWNRGLGF
jgi:hypothetical protein